MTSQLLDALTGAYTRAMFNTRLQNEVERALRYSQPLSVLMLDLDYFKSINDAFGHARGDEALIGVVARIKSQLREADEVFRYGGDEFVALLPNTPKDEAINIARRILLEISGQPIPGKPPLSLSVSIGVACAPREAQTAQALFEVADQRHYISKQTGRGRVTGDDSQRPVSQEQQPMDRLLGRDSALDTVRTFLDALDVSTAANLEVLGTPGSGRTRLLQEVHRLARIRGYAVMLLSGNPAIKHRLYGALHETISKWLEYTQFISASSLANFFQDLIERKALKGLVILLDNWQELDNGSLDAIQHLSQLPGLGKIGLVFSAVTRGESPAPEFRAAHTFSAALNALNASEMRAWLRHGLGNEPSEEVLGWFVKHTNGIPALINRSLEFLGEPQHQSLAWAQLCPRLESHLLGAEHPRNNLPLNLSLLVGRERELQQIRLLLRQSRPLALLGLGGVGKTRLALQAALESQKYFPDGVYFIPVAPLVFPENIYTAIGQVLGHSLPPGNEGLETLKRLLSDKKILLVLDNFESLPDAAPLLLPLLNTAPGLQILITSRVAPNLHDEINLNLEGLDCPPEQAAEARPYASTTLFAQLAHQVDPAFTPDWAAIGEICRLTDGLPLAIELAAAWVSTFSCQQIANQIKASLIFLSSHNNHPADPHYSIQAIFESLWNLFSPQEAKNLAGLGIFEGHFSRAAAWQVTEVSPFFLDALTAKTILRCTNENHYRIQPMLWDFLRQKLQQDPSNTARLAEQHALFYFNALCERASFFLNGEQECQAIFETQAQIQNLRAAWQFALQNQRADLLTPALGPYCTFLRALGWFSEAQTLLQKTLPILAHGPAKTYFQNVILLAEFFYHTGHYLESVSLLEQVLPQIPRNCQQGLAMHRLSLSYYALGHRNDSLRLLQKGSLLARELNDPALIFEFSNRAAISAYAVKEFGHAITLGSQALEQAQKLGLPEQIARATNNLANFYYEQGDLPNAQKYINLSLALMEKINALALKTSIYDSAGKILAVSGDPLAAKRAFWEGLTLLKKMHASPLAAELLTGVAELWQREALSALALPLARFVVRQSGVPRPILERAQTLALLPGDNSWELQKMEDAVSEVTQRLRDEILAAEDAPSALEPASDFSRFAPSEETRLQPQDGLLDGGQPQGK